MKKGYKGKFKPSYPKKYKGDPTNIIYRSLWELKFMNWCDKNVNVIKWSSEEIIIPYISPVDRRPHRYFPDFYVESRNRTGRSQKRVIEVKPYAQTRKPKLRKGPRYLAEVRTYGVNQAKWKAAREYCRDRKMEFMILTEKELKV